MNDNEILYHYLRWLFKHTDLDLSIPGNLEKTQLEFEEKMKLTLPSWLRLKGTNAISKKTDV
jgi:hypothetical protein